jgi:predicted permease
MGNLALLLFCFVAGIALRRTGRLPQNAPAALNAFIINISLPAMALGYLNKVELQPAYAYAAAMPWIMFAVGFAVLWPLCRVMRLSRRTTGCVILLGGLANTSFIGIPMIEAFYGDQWVSVGIVADQLGSFIVLAVLGISVARVFSGGDKPAWRDIAIRIFGFPPFIATIVALLLMPFTYPAWLDTMLLRLAATVAPLALVSVGFQLRLSDLRGKTGPLALALTYKLLVGPLVILGLYAWLLGANGPLIQVTIFEAAMAPMISAAIVAMENDLDPPLATLLVGVGIPLSFLTLPVWHQLLLAI